MKSKKAQIWISTIFAVLVTVAAIYVLSRILSGMTMLEFETALGKIHPMQLLAALFLTAVCYAALSVYDWFALKILGYSLKWKNILSGSVAAYSLSHNLGFAPITATAARWRVYAPDGVKFSDIARIACLTGLAFWFGVIAQAGIMLIAGIGNLSKQVPIAIPSSAQMAVGLCVMLVFLCYIFANRMGITRYGWKGLSMPTATTGQAITQSVLSLVEIGLASTILWLLIPGATIEHLAAVYIAYLIAFTSVLITHAPGGVGVLEAIAISMLPELGAANVLVGLLLFRIVFHIIPLIVGAAIMVKSPAVPMPEPKPQTT